MKYFVISKEDIPKAVILHDYYNGLFTFRSKSNYLTAAIDCALNSIYGSTLYKSNDRLVIANEFNARTPSFSDKLIEKLTFSGLWELKDSGDLVDIAEFEEISEKLLSQNKGPL